ncbi:Bug family tripartite tricarboxylate transporter substrate binding protein [Variovorax sp. PBL-E5]|uniref:Bug family tripartite tricarboxylate transporter substrate binding protein n=1 Tax=Variovorax sp. PBL-E5 TaxID=434014 RepID=UPI001318668D|nr:tripartite tricarboxylate transporter substrate binding protein [Variovorax sp. PBL-E5]VTU23717.1 Argininosuccinate lyase [Variovorax sp. PBL-E5]
MRRILLAAFAALIVSLPGWAAADTWPSRPITLVYPFPPGGSDAAVRVFAERLGAALGQPVVVDNRGGAGGNIGAESVARAAPDGYTLMIGTNGALAINSLLYPNMHFDPLKDFEPISGFVTSPQVLFINSTVPAKSVAELIALAKAEPGKLTFASVGQGSASQLTMEMFKMATGTDLVHVPYKGAGPAMVDVMAGRISMMAIIASSIVPHMGSDKVRVLAVTADKRFELLPEVPTLKELGIDGVESWSWLAMVAPKGTPEPIVRRINAEMKKILTDPAVKKKLNGFGVQTNYSSPEAVTAAMKNDQRIWGRVIQESGTKIE